MAEEASSSSASTSASSSQAPAPELDPFKKLKIPEGDELRDYLESDGAGGILCNGQGCGKHWKNADLCKRTSAGNVQINKGNLKTHVDTHRRVKTKADAKGQGGGIMSYFNKPKASSSSSSAAGSSENPALLQNR